MHQITHPNDLPHNLDLLERAKAPGGKGYSIEKRILRKGGEHFWAQVTSSSVLDATGKFLYAVRVQHDITDRKRAEQALARRMEMMRVRRTRLRIGRCC